MRRTLDELSPADRSPRSDPDEALQATLYLFLHCRQRVARAPRVRDYARAATSDAIKPNAHPTVADDSAIPRSSKLYGLLCTLLYAGPPDT